MNKSGCIYLFSASDGDADNRSVSRRPVSMREVAHKAPQQQQASQQPKKVAFGGNAMDRNPRDMRIPPKEAPAAPSAAANGKPKKPQSLEKMFPKKAEIKKLTGANIINKPSIHLNGQKDSANIISGNNNNNNNNGSHGNNNIGKKVNFQQGQGSPNSARGAGAGLSGFAKLQQMAKVKGGVTGGPAIVTYESDEGELPSYSKNQR